MEGDDSSYDWGTDYSECAIIKFYEKEGVKELTPFLCACDFPIADALGIKKNNKKLILSNKMTA